MIISVQFHHGKGSLFTYNAPTDIEVGDEVIVPVGDNNAERVALVVRRGRMANTGYSGPIKGIIGKATPRSITVTGKTDAELRDKLYEAIDDLGLNRDLFPSMELPRSTGSRGRRLSQLDLPLDLADELS